MASAPPEATARFIVGHVLSVLATIPDGSVDLALCSPPFLGLRHYLPDDDPSKHLEMGSESTPGEFLDNLLVVVEELGRVLAPHGSIAVELGDSYAGSGNGPDAHQPEGRGLWNDRWRGERDGWPMDKSLCMIPELFRFALAYGFNPLTGKKVSRWRVRNVVRWCRPNPPVGALGDKFRPAVSEMAIACRGRTRYFDLDAVRTPLTEPGAVKKHSTEQRNPSLGWKNNSAEIHQNENGSPPLDHWWSADDEDEDFFGQEAWLISIEPYPGTHYATWPRRLLERPIKAMCPQKVCTVCGKPSERIVESTRNVSGDKPLPSQAAQVGRGRHSGYFESAPAGGSVSSYKTLGWSDCGHDSWRSGLVLDPFAGSGTTLAVAFGHGRSSIGIDLDKRNADLARQRVGMWLQVEEHAPC